MWQFLQGVGPPAKKTKQTPDEIKNKQKEYDNSSRTRSYQSKWEQEFKDWLLFDGKHMFCRPCRSAYGQLSIDRLPDQGAYKQYSKGPFITGCANFKHYALKTHASSEGHKIAVAHVISRQAPAGTSKAEQSIQKLNASVFNKLSLLFRTAHAVAKHNRPFSDFAWLTELDAKKGLDIGETYRNDKSCKEFISSISAVERERICEEFSEHKFVTILSDGSTDVSTTENEIVYCRSAHRGDISIVFCSMKAMGKANSEGVYEACTQSICETLGSDTLDKVVAFAADGASVNTGHLNGVIAKLRDRLSPSIIMIRCLAHRMELAFQNAVKSKAFDAFTQLLSQLYRMYKSPLQRHNLKESFDALNMRHSMPTRIGGTRWLSHTLTAIQKLRGGYRGFVHHLRQMADDRTQGLKAKALLKLMSSKSVILHMLFLQDILTVLSAFSRALQNAQSSIYLVHEQLQSAMVSLGKLEERPGHFLSEVYQLDMADKCCYEGEELKGNFVYPSVIVKKIMDCMQNRFSDISSGLLKSTQIVDMTSWPTSYSVEFGDDVVHNLTSHFKAVLKKQECQVEMVSTEWDLLKQLLYDSEKIYELTWPDINNKYISKVPNFLMLVDLVLTLPASSAECERGFSAMKMLKTDYRNRLSSSSMTELLRVKMHSAGLSDFDPTAAIHYWNGCRRTHRRPVRAKQTQSFVEVIPEDDEAQVAAVVADQREQGAAVSDSVQDDLALDDSDFEDCGSDYDSDTAPDDQELFDLAYSL